MKDPKYITIAQNLNDYDILSLFELLFIYLKVKV